METTRGNFDTRVEHTPGSPQWPMTAPELSEKFLDCAARALGGSAASKLLAALEQLPTMSDTIEATRLTVSVRFSEDVHPGQRRCLNAEQTQPYRYAGWAAKRLMPAPAGR